MELELLEEAVDKLIRSQDIELYYAEYEFNDPDTVVIRENKPAIIIININFETNIPIVARKSHELSHVIYGSDEPSVYNFSIGLRNESEKIANKGMVNILAKLAFYETPLEYRSPYKFMEAFHFPTLSYEKMVIEAIENV
ncbi:hypothetical protein JC2156_05660 [Weissella koreensis KCTC 3621]|uniref:hypothetical protein n=1 Tax=Weissella koreensis TaxID=165096 RepID=UPI00026F3EF0|nr:hypothetical protein [Weissella koreensis]EJF33752.1 hypothetical protein JC2156_05660 [Weissella koreensis KCTC 3621]